VVDLVGLGGLVGLVWLISWLGSAGQKQQTHVSAPKSKDGCVNSYAWNNTCIKPSGNVLLFICVFWYVSHTNHNNKT
jgi:hypothetical protein